MMTNPNNNLDNLFLREMKRHERHLVWAFILRVALVLLWLALGLSILIARGWDGASLLMVGAGLLMTWPVIWLLRPLGLRGHVALLLLVLLYVLVPPDLWEAGSGAGWLWLVQR